MFQIIEVRMNRRQRRHPDARRLSHRRLLSKVVKPHVEGERICLFDGAIVDPSASRCFLADLVVDEEFARLLDEVRLRDECDIQTGWYSAQFFELLRSLILVGLEIILLTSTLHKIAQIHPNPQRYDFKRLACARSQGGKIAAKT